ncbi:MAG: cytochrome c oxidase subunit 3 [Planctomycetota bacterium]|jgi:heme/copper-type cytochrome/quinol oxidase subunit 3
MWISSFKPNGTLAVRPNDPSAHRRLDESQGVGAFGVKLFLASLSFLFAASILLYLILLVPAEKPEMAILPVVGAGLGVATLVMLASSFTYARALKAIRSDDRGRFARLMRWTFGLGLAFMIAQSINWAQLFSAGLPIDAENRHSGFFLVLTVLHALHVVGGLIPLGVVTRRAGRGDYTSTHYEGVANVALYWHFLDVVWVLMLVAIVAVSA